MAICGAFGDCEGRGNTNAMMTQRYETKREPSGRIGTTPEERYVARAMAASIATANATLTLGIAKGWKFRCRPGNEVAMWLPGAGETATTYTVTNAALWRAIKNRGEGLT